jgi:hypothetical protein
LVLGTVDAAACGQEDTFVKLIAGIVASFGLLLAAPMAPVESAASCPEVDAAQAMLLKAAAAKNDQDLKQMPRNVPPGGPPQPGTKGQAPQPGQPPAQAKGKSGTQPQPAPGQPAPSGQPGQAGQTAEQDKEAPPNVETAPVPEDLQRAALLVKQADDACQCGHAVVSSE